MDISSFSWIVSTRWVRRTFLYAAFLAAVLCFGTLRRHEPITWLEMLPFVGWALPIVGISVAIALKKWTHGGNSQTAA